MGKRITKFSQITALLPYPVAKKGQLQSIHSTIVTEVMKLPSISRSETRKIVTLVNTLSYKCIKNETLHWNPENPLDYSMLDINEDTLQNELGDMYLIVKNIDWKLDNIEVTADSVASSIQKPSETSTDIKQPKMTPLQFKEIVPPSADVNNATSKSTIVISPTPKEDLYIQPPVIPQFNVAHAFVSGQIGDCNYVIYDSLPAVPKKQNEISVTTDVAKMTSKDLHNLYPNHRVQTRAAVMYQPYSNLELHPVLGLVLPISGFTREQWISNLIEYPHLFRLAKVVDGENQSFYPTIEINGELHKVQDIWNDLPESKFIPYNKDFVKEYVVRRYLLERDYKHIEHKYPLFGTLDKYLTLFTTPDEYISLGIIDIEGIAKQCVAARISYKQSRNPVIRRLKDAKLYI